LTRVFLLSPAHCGGRRARILVRPEARFELAERLRSPAGVPLGDVFSFLSGLYFRGKLAYARAFARAPEDVGAVWVITPGAGLRRPDDPIDLDTLLRFAEVAVDEAEPRYLEPLVRDVRRLATGLGPGSEVVLLGSVATRKYVDVLLPVLGEHLRFPKEFVGRGDMSRGGLLLRCVDARRELEYVAVDGAVRRGQRPPRLPRRA
jgi:hypothetical protein